jgi:post-segregation antitoxin (ccd killing protein)
MEETAMAKKQTRRSISITKRMYDQLTEASRARGIPIARLVENAIAPDLGLVVKPAKVA